jgi:hypothetical protein
LLYSIKFEGSLEVKLPTIWTDGKAEVERVREEEEEKESADKRYRCAKSRETMCFSNVVQLRRLKKVGSLKWRAWSHVAR